MIETPHERDNSSMRLATPLLALTLAALACADDTPGPGPEAGTETDSDGTDSDDSDSETGTDSGGEQDWLPPECVGLSSPFLDDCREALTEACASFTTEDACPTEVPLWFEGGFEVYCGWAEVRRVSDEASCQVEAPTMRCIAGVVPGAIACADPCTIDAPDLYSAFRVFADEFVAPGCSPDGFAIDWFGPHDLCADNIAPPAPSICACAQAVCDAG